VYTLLVNWPACLAAWSRHCQVPGYGPVTCRHKDNVIHAGPHQGSTMHAKMPAVNRECNACHIGLALGSKLDVKMQARQGYLQKRKNYLDQSN
jgi:hypothetical protein